MDTLRGQTSYAYSTKLMVYLKRENYATEVVLLNQENGFDFDWLRLAIRWGSRSSRMWRCVGVRSSRRFERSLCFPRKGEVAPEDVLDSLTLGASHAARSI